MADLICWCFGYTEEDILKDLEQNGAIPDHGKDHGRE
jgi:hypothetical protein